MSSSLSNSDTLSQSSSPAASRSSSHLASGAIAGIVVGVVVAVACLLGLIWVGIRYTRSRREGNRVEAMPHTKEYGELGIGNGSLRVELDGKGAVPELASHDIRHEMNE